MAVTVERITSVNGELVRTGPGEVRLDERLGWSAA